MNITILPVQFGEKLYHQTALLARRCSFQGSGRYLSELMTDNALEGYERVYCAVYCGRVVGFCALMQESYCEDDHTPWLDFVFVEEPFRRQGVAREMVAEVKRYAQALGIGALYLCTSSHERYYQSLGFCFVKDVQINECTMGKMMKIDLC